MAWRGMKRKMAREISQIGDVEGVGGDTEGEYRRCFFETIDHRPQTAFDWPHPMLATSRQRILIHSSNPCYR